MFIFLHLILCAMMAGIPSMLAQPRAGYAMYVWTRGFDHTVAGCDVTKFMEWDKSDNPCFTHTWDTASKRQWLWDTCNLAGREVGRIFLSDVHKKLKDSFQAQSCASSNVQLVKTTLAEGHSRVSDLLIYALFAVSDEAVSEGELVNEVVWYNDNCAADSTERFDGVAVNNEAYSKIKNGDLSSRVAYLDRLNIIMENARRQRHCKLLTHYSISWHWGKRTDAQNDILWHGRSQNATCHMIDIFDSTDVQVGYTRFSAISNRMNTAGYLHAVSTQKPIFTTLYTNKGSPCQSSFFPGTCKSWHDGSERGMFHVIDQFSEYGIPLAKPCIHYFRGVYSSGGHPDWPSHKQ